MSEEPAVTPKKRRPLLRWMVVLIAVLLVIGAIITALLWKPWQKEEPGLPQTIASQITSFKPYYFPADIPNNFILKKESITYSSGVLLFQLQDPSKKQTISVTEQQLPSSLNSSSYPNAEQIKGADGDAIITYSGTKVIGALFSNAHGNSKTLVIMNSTDPIPKETVADLLRGIRPVKAE